MTGLRRASLSTACAALLLASCGTDTKDLPPLASEVNVKDPRADALFADGLAAETSGNVNKAIKLYEATAQKYPYSEVAAKARFRQGILLEADGELLEAFDAYQYLIQRYQSSSLYTEARNKQAVVAHAAAQGLIKNNFLGIKSRLDSKKIVEMLETVRANAPRAPSAPKAQFRVGEVLENRKKIDKAIVAFQQVVDDYASSPYAPEAQFRIGDIYLSSAVGGDQNPANLDKARHTFDDLIQTYPNSKRAADARKKLSEIGSRDIQRSYEIAQFYDKKGQTTSAAFYYEEVLRKSSGGTMHERAKRRLQEIKGSSN